MPKYFNVKMREAIMAGPLAINFRSFSFHFFETGLKLARIVNDAHLPELRVAFCSERYKMLMDMAIADDAQDDVSEYRQQLTAAELILFDAGLRSTRDIRTWMSSSRRLKQSDILSTRNNAT